ncbi:MAG: hypothetical protein ACJ75H_04950 [Thermoanaerobaculia bacterium]
MSDPYRKLVLDECVDDYTGLWQVIADLKDESGGAIGESGILDLLHGLLAEGLIVAGFPTRDGRGFEPWPYSPQETIDRIRAEWRKLGRDPVIGEVVWFNAAS